jgi:hypothetical protein
MKLKIRNNKHKLLEKSGIKMRSIALNKSIQLHKQT